METFRITPVIDLPRGRMLRLAESHGRSISVFEGLVWITQSGDERDIILGPGETFEFDHDGLALVEALSHTRMVLCAECVGNGVTEMSAGIIRWPSTLAVEAGLS